MTVGQRLRASRHRAIRAVTMAIVLAVVLRPAASGAQVANESSSLPPDPSATRLFFGPTARSLAPGSGYAGVYGLFLPFAQVGLTDRIELGGGAPLLVPGGLSTFWLTPKVQIVRGPTVQAAVGAMHVVSTGYDSGAGGVAYGVATLGTPDRAFTFGAGWSYETGPGGDGHGPIVLAGAERRVSRRTKLISENYLSPGGGLLSGGARLIGERFSADVGMAVFLVGDTAIGFPFVNVACRFGDGK